MNNQELLALSLIKGLGNKSLNNINQKYENMEDLLNAENNIFSQLVGKNKSDVFFEIRENYSKYLIKAQEIEKKCLVEDIGVLSINDKLFPDSLKTISDPPVFIFYRGNIELIRGIIKIGVIGTRSPTIMGNIITKKFSRAFSEKNAVIVSGLALGIDSTAHKATLNKKSSTIAVLVDLKKIYPSSNIDLANNIIENDGLLISENIPGININKGLFLKRDRIIAALSNIIIPVEFSVVSGTMKTLKYAMKYNKKIIVPALENIDSSFWDEGIKYLLENQLASEFDKKDYDNIISGEFEEKHIAKEQSIQMSIESFIDERF